MSDFGFNLLSEAIGVSAELVIVYLIVNYLLERKERTKWAPARKIIVSNIAKTYCTSYHAATQLVNFEYKKSDHNEPDKVKGKSIYFKIAIHDFQKLNKTVELNNAALDSNLMPIVSEFLESSENLLKKLKYYIQIHNDEFASKDFVSEPPFLELETIENLVSKLKENYCDVFKDKRIVFDYLKTCDEIKEAWKRAAGNTDRMFFEPSRYQYRKGKSPFLYDLDNLRKLHVTDAEHGVQVEVYSTY